MDKQFYELAFQCLSFEDAVEHCIKYSLWYINRCIDGRVKLIQYYDLLNNYGIAVQQMN